MTLAEDDTLFYEQLAISSNNGILIFWATVQGQNNDQPVGFALKGGKTDSLIFENPSHDFPNRISYHRKADSSLFVRVENQSRDKGFNIYLSKE